MSIRGAQQFYYSRQLPSRSVAIAEISVPVLTPAKLTDINNEIYGVGALAVWKTSTGISSSPDYPAPDLNVPIQISGSLTYFVGSQFFELTNVLAADGTTHLFYQHQLPQGATHIQIVDLTGTDVTPSTMKITSGNMLYHSMDGGAYRVQFINSQGSLVQIVLRYDHVVATSVFAAGPGLYNLSGATLSLPDTGAYWLRFTKRNGYQVMPMYTYLPNTPWYPRISFGLNPPPVDWARQTFVNAPPWVSGTFIAGKVLDLHMIQFERLNMFNDGIHLPDILVFDSSNKFKFALDGFSGSSTAASVTPYLKGTVYPWQRGRISSIDYTNARVDVALELDPTDIIWGFYSYAESDVIYSDFDCNPFTNPVARNTILQLYVKFDGQDPNRNIYHQLLDASGGPIAGQTNDLSPLVGTNHIFAQIVIGASISEADFSFTDARVRGGGLAPEYQSIPPAVNFWDIGYWDGKPYPIGGALAIYLPYTILESQSRTQIQETINSILPMGAIAVVRYIDTNGNEWV